jgi:hypothetical protein
MGKHKYIETPEKMWELFEGYRRKVKSTPFIVTDWVGGMAKEVNRTKEKPLTLEGFELYCYDNEIITDLSKYFANTDNKYSDYCAICSRIRLEIRNDQIAGGMAGIYNPSITQRLNNLVDKQETSINIPPMFKD